MIGFDVISHREFHSQLTTTFYQCHSMMIYYFHLCNKKCIYIEVCECMLTKLSHHFLQRVIEPHFLFSLTMCVHLCQCQLKLKIVTKFLFLFSIFLADWFYAMSESEPVRLSKVCEQLSKWIRKLNTHTHAHKRVASEHTENLFNSNDKISAERISFQMAMCVRRAHLPQPVSITIILFSSD